VGVAISLGLRQAALAAFNVCAPSYQGCPTTLRGDLSQGQGASTALNVFAVLAVAGLGAGVPMFIVGSRRKAPPASAISFRSLDFSVLPAAGGAGASAAVRY
jgi:hypothetical protein